MADAPKATLDDIQSQQDDLANTLRAETSTSQEKSEARAKLNEFSAQAGKLRKEEIAKISDADEKKVVQLHEKGVQFFEIAKEVYKFANQDTVAQVISIVRKHYADDYAEVEKLKDYKGYTGI